MTRRQREKQAARRRYHQDKPKRRKRQTQWLDRVVALEDERGAFPPGGFGGGVVARARREAKGKP